MKKRAKYLLVGTGIALVGTCVFAAFSHPTKKVAVSVKKGKSDIQRQSKQNTLSTEEWVKRRRQRAMDIRAKRMAAQTSIVPVSKEICKTDISAEHEEKTGNDRITLEMNKPLS